MVPYRDMLEAILVKGLLGIESVINEDVSDGEPDNSENLRLVTDMLA